jgi:hypothetical protein
MMQQENQLLINKVAILVQETEIAGKRDSEDHSI